MKCPELQTGSDCDDAYHSLPCLPRSTKHDLVTCTFFVPKPLITCKLRITLHYIFRILYYCYYTNYLSLPYHLLLYCYCMSNPARFISVPACARMQTQADFCTCNRGRKNSIPRPHLEREFCCMGFCSWTIPLQQSGEIYF